LARDIQPIVWYTKQEMRKLLTAERSKALADRGYDTLQMDATTGKMRIAKGTDGSVTGTGMFTPPPLIEKRTAQQRLDSMVLNLVDGMREAGGIAPLQSGVAPRVSLGDGTSRPPTTEETDRHRRMQVEEQVKIEQGVREIVGEAWKQGRSEITADVVRQVAGGLLSRSEAQHEAKLDKQITRHED